jgi:hypothetical protein
MICSCGKSEKIVVGTVDLGETKMALTIEADSLVVPWDLQYDRINNCIIFSEIAGEIKKLDLETNEVVQLERIPNVFHQRTTGLLGMALYQISNEPH